ncbi:carboxypeptidase S1, CPD-S1 [Gigaspora rosea]|uniref:Carboxypeptidase S1, CPD-S1 n=1 Tax=Gigaspora rosea TaxID=44941 RepID=A0A397UYB1_9GLOM|nr:carboxypeptidase S1, CPD-S1 [Gigaspora rosea]
MIFKKLYPNFFSSKKIVIFFILFLLTIIFNNKSYVAVLNDHIVSSKLCDPNVKQHSGYLNIAPDANMFFWFFESRKNPQNSPLTIWISGGPGYSSMFALFQEVGPCKVEGDTNKSGLSENSWNEVTNLLFIDQPIGTGFSYGARMVNTSEQAASDIYEFLQRFFAIFPKYASLDLHFFSESYGGHYVPVMAKHIIQKNNLIKTDRIKDIIPINLKSCGIGAAWVDPNIQLSYISFTENNTYEPLLDSQLIKEMHDKWTLCKHDIDECYKTNMAHACIAANITCNEDYMGIFTQNSDAGLYNIRTKSGIPDPVYTKYLENPFVLKSIGVNTTEVTKYLEVNDEIYYRFADTGELMRSTMSQVEFLLDNDIPILFFTGDADYICNWFGANEMTESLKWKRHQEFKNAIFQKWTVDGLRVGEIRKVKNLWFVKVFEAGHFVPHDQPRNSLELFNMWIKSL